MARAPSRHEYQCFSCASWQLTAEGDTLREIYNDVISHVLPQNPNRTILGAPQQKFLFDSLSAAQGKQTWKILGQQVRFQLPSHAMLCSASVVRKCIISRCPQVCCRSSAQRSQ